METWVKKQLLICTSLVKQSSLQVMDTLAAATTFDHWIPPSPFPPALSLLLPWYSDIPHWIPGTWTVAKIKVGQFSRCYLRPGEVNKDGGGEWITKNGHKECIIYGPPENPSPATVWNQLWLGQREFQSKGIQAEAVVALTTDSQPPTPETTNSKVKTEHTN